jgi:elongation factor 1-gamma
VAEYSGVTVDLVKDFEMGVSNKTPQFLKMNPIGKVCKKSFSEYRYCIQ